MFANNMLGSPMRLLRLPTVVVILAMTIFYEEKNKNTFSGAESLPDYIGTTVPSQRFLDYKR